MLIIKIKIARCQSKVALTAFLLGRGIRQGDPLSPYLFKLALETLAIKIREDCNVQGLKIGEEMIKLSLFTDDTTCVFKDKTSYTNLFHILNSFGECSGLKVNDENRNHASRR